MKKNLIALVATYLIFVACTYGAGAQGTHNVTDFTQTKAFRNTLRFQIFTSDSIMKSNMGNLEVNAKAIKDFKGRFGKALNEQWCTTPDGFETYFLIDGYADRAFYNKKGRWQYTIKTYREDKLPFEVRRLVKSTYFDYSISLVQEVDAPDNFVYLIHLDDNISIKIIRVTQDLEMDVMEDFQKG